MRNLSKLFLILSVIFIGCKGEESKEVGVVYQDKPYLQDYAVKYYSQDSTIKLTSIAFDRNGVTSVLASNNVYRLTDGQFQSPGRLTLDRSHKPLVDLKIIDIQTHNGDLYYLTSDAVFTNAFGGRAYYTHSLHDAKSLTFGADSTFLVASESTIQRYRGSSNEPPITGLEGSIQEIHYNSSKASFIVATSAGIFTLSESESALKKVLTKEGITSISSDGKQIYVGTNEGYLVVDASTFAVTSPLNNALPVPAITTIRKIGDWLWFGSSQGAFAITEEGTFNYYFGERWLPSNEVVDIISIDNGNVAVLTKGGVGEIRFEEMTLEQKALRYEDQVRKRHIRYGFNCDIVHLKNGDLSTSEMGQRESDNLWTSMYLVSQLMRYKVTGEAVAQTNYRESFSAMERLYEMTGMDGYFARSFERHGQHKLTEDQKEGEPSTGWTRSKDKNWDWKGKTSSDQTVGQMFALTMLAEHGDESEKKRAIHLIDKLMTNIIKNNWYLIDFDGKPTEWGKWNPVYVNGFPSNVGDRKLYSSNIIAFLQTAYHFTKKEVYKEKAYELMEKHGYLENLLRSFNEIGKAPEGADEHAANLSESWNHSDDEMYFLAYWGLYPYAFDGALKEQYREAIKEHWNLERPEKNGLWNLCYAMTGAKEFDLAETAWFLKEFPMDMIEWGVSNTHRKDLKFLPENFREQFIEQVLPPDERPHLKHNKNYFILDRSSSGTSELSAGDSFLLPYWLGRYLGVISPAQK